MRAMKQKKSVFKIVVLPLICVLCLLIAGFSIYKVYTIQSEYNAAAAEYESMRASGVYHAPEPEATAPAPSELPADEEQPDPENLAGAEDAEFFPLSVDFDAKRNREGISEIVAWIYCPSTVIDYPVVQHSDDDYYLHHNARGAESGSGAIFMNSFNYKDFSDKNTILYGHHMNDKSMFCTLEFYMNQEYYDEHPVFYLSTATGDNYRADVVSAFTTPAGSAAYKMEFRTQMEWEEWVDWIKEQSRIETAVQATYDDRYLTLSTCSYDYENQRTVCVLRLSLVNSGNSLES